MLFAQCKTKQLKNSKRFTPSNKTYFERKYRLKHNSCKALLLLRNISKNVKSLKDLQNNLSRLQLLVLIPYRLAHLIFLKAAPLHFLARVA